MSEPIPNPRACVFRPRWGPLVNSLRDIAEALNHCLELLGLPTYSHQNATATWSARAFPSYASGPSAASHPHLVAPARRAGSTALPHAGAAATPGRIQACRNSIERLRAQGHPKLAVLSNKPHDLTVRIVQHLLVR